MSWPPVAEPVAANPGPARESRPVKLPVDAKKALERARADAATVEGFIAKASSANAAPPVADALAAFVAEAQAVLAKVREALEVADEFDAYRARYAEANADVQVLAARKLEASDDPDVDDAAFAAIVAEFERHKANRSRLGSALGKATGTLPDPRLLLPRQLVGAHKAGALDAQGDALELLQHGTVKKLRPLPGRSRRDRLAALAGYVAALGDASLVVSQHPWPSEPARNAMVKAFDAATAKRLVAQAEALLAQGASS